MTTDNTPAVVEHGSALALSAEQTKWNEQQLVALRHIGVENASDGDLMVFHHVCQRTGLDPFARQIHMIGRKAREQVDGEWQYVTKQTIQTGIDGFRLIGRRAANATHQKVSVSAPQWAREDGSWREVWINAWGYPVAAKVTITRDGEPFTAVALFDEYKQTKSNGNLTAMWEQRRAGQLAKCAEALAWRMAFPQDLSGIYTDDEMGQADSGTSAAAAPQPSTAGRRGIAGALRADHEPVDDVVQGEVVEDQPPADESPLLNTSSALAKRMFALFNEAGVSDRAKRLQYVVDVVGREIESSSQMTDRDAEQVIKALENDLEHPFPDTTTIQNGATS